MAYTHVQFVAYDINTMPVGQTYLGLADPGQDIEARCALMLRAMETARDALPQSSPPAAPGEVLKVFMAPEFFFRGATGAYDIAVVEALVTRLQGLAGDPAGGWDDWVFSYGTIVCGLKPAGGGPIEIFNYALVQEGGAASAGPGGARAVMKELISGIDFLTGYANPGGILLGEVTPPAAAPPGPGRETQRVNYDGAGIFTLRGISWAMDICLDHMEQRLVRSPQLPGEQQVQIQLVPSAGTDAGPYETIPAAGGYVFQVDGAGHGSGLRQAGGATIAASPPVAVPGDAITLTSVSPPQLVMIDQLYGYGAGQIVCYPVQAVPPASTVPGSSTALVWPTKAGYTITFDVVNDATGAFVTVMMTVEGPNRPIFGSRAYFLPLMLETTDQGKPISISASVRPGASGYNRGVWCDIAIANFSFEGFAFLFDANTSPGGQVRNEDAW